MKALEGFELPQPAALSCVLHAYQRQAMGWMLWREMSDAARQQRGEPAIGGTRPAVRGPQ